MAQLATIVIIANLASACLASFCDPDSQYKLVFEDDFEGTLLNTTNWTPSEGQGGSLGRDAWLLVKNVYLENGDLVLKSEQNDYGFNYTTGAVTSRDKAFFKYGRICVNAMLPGGKRTQDHGVWPAHWMMPNDKSCWPDHGEIDILEMVDGKGLAHGTYHWNRFFPNQTCMGGKGNTHYSNQTIVENWNNTYHEYAVEWTEDHIMFLVDGQPYLNVTEQSQGVPSGHPQLPPSPMHLLLNTAIGGPWPGKPNNETIFPLYHRIDYVKVAQIPTT
eukprot:TRINITY_DN11899_c2_g1_i1.p2 TRINITY_DN11899_c2_g1~~TRINITY_DN11899_c2_g1_i1.p2  ORF type:complete len:274 (+),score=47.23 TRINITY_DN11899_c2_g1_i1:5201-6022(+)